MRSDCSMLLGTVSLECEGVEITEFVVFSFKQYLRR